MVKTAPRVDFDYVILGASHSAVFDYRDLNARLEEMTGSTILNLSIVGAGVTVNRLLLDYFLVAHRTRSLVYVLDSFAFYSREWNEERLADARLFHRAPFDPALARLLVGAREAVGRPRLHHRLFEDQQPRQVRAGRPPGRRQPLRADLPAHRAARSTTHRVSLSRRHRRRGDRQSRPLSRGARTISSASRALAASGCWWSGRLIPARSLRIIPGEAEFDAALEDASGTHRGRAS